jgi:hypothetical protein
MKTSNSSSRHSHSFRSPRSLIILFTLALPASADLFSVTNLVTDDQTVNAAQITDPALVNAWGISFAATSPFWVSDNGTGKSTLYRINPGTDQTTKVGLEVTIPGAGTVTGQVFSGIGVQQQFVSNRRKTEPFRMARTAQRRNARAPSSAVYKGSR